MGPLGGILHSLGGSMGAFTAATAAYTTFAQMDEHARHQQLHGGVFGMGSRGDNSVAGRWRPDVGTKARQADVTAWEHRDDGLWGSTKLLGEMAVDQFARRGTAGMRMPDIYRRGKELKTMQEQVAANEIRAGGEQEEISARATTGERSAAVGRQGLSTTTGMRLSAENTAAGFAISTEVAKQRSKEIAEAKPMGSYGLEEQYQDIAGKASFRERWEKQQQEQQSQGKQYETDRAALQKEQDERRAAAEKSTQARVTAEGEETKWKNRATAKVSTAPLTPGRPTASRIAGRIASQIASAGLVDAVGLFGGASSGKMGGNETVHKGTTEDEAKWKQVQDNKAVAFKQEQSDKERLVSITDQLSTSERQRGQALAQNSAANIALLAEERNRLMGIVDAEEKRMQRSKLSAGSQTTAGHQQTLYLARRVAEVQRGGGRPLTESERAALRQNDVLKGYAEKFDSERGKGRMDQYQNILPELGKQRADQARKEAEDISKKIGGAAPPPGAGFEGLNKVIGDQIGKDKTAIDDFGKGIGDGIQRLQDAMKEALQVQVDAINAKVDRAILDWKIQHHGLTGG